MVHYSMNNYTLIKDWCTPANNSRFYTPLFFYSSHVFSDTQIAEYNSQTSVKRVSVISLDVRKFHMFGIA